VYVVPVTQAYGPPATIPAPLIDAENATCTCVAKKAPEDKPETDVSLGSALYADNFYN
jgi:hypothetical protein